MTIIKLYLLILTMSHIVLLEKTSILFLILENIKIYYKEVIYSKNRGTYLVFEVFIFTKR